MFNWVEIGVENNCVRYETLSAYLSENGFPNKVEFKSITPQDLERVLPELLNKCQGIRVGRGLGEAIVPFFQGSPILVQQLKAADAIQFENKRWGLRANAVEGMSHVLSRAGELFDLDSSVLIVGTGAASKVAIASLFRAGFKKFAISSLDLGKVQLLIDGLKRSMFGAEFRIVRKEDLVLLPGTHGVLVNTTPMSDDNPLLSELYYFNFFKQGGVAIDFTIQPIDTPILKGARDVGAHCIFGYQISAYTDIIWAEHVSGMKFDARQYEERLEKALSDSALLNDKTEVRP